MPIITVTTDDGKVIDTYTFPIESIYALAYMPGCPTNTRVHDMLNWLSRALCDAETGGRIERPSETVMRLMHEKGHV